MKTRKGDTLIEVMLAIGIFSMIAISAVAVMSGGISGSQTALEATLAREEIDAQAEALRFIQSSYAAEKGAEIKGSIYEEIWTEISGGTGKTGRVIDVATDLVTEDDKTDFKKATSDNNPATCNELYNNKYVQENSFIINHKQFASAEGDTIKEKAEKIFIPFDGTQLIPATVYPRLVYNGDDDATLLTNSEGTLQSAEGIYVIATTNSKDSPTYYDFYIRTCWYGTGDEFPTSVATVVRLYDPLSIYANSSGGTNSVFVTFHSNGGHLGVGQKEMGTLEISEGQRLPENVYIREQYHFNGWNVNEDGTGKRYANREKFFPPEGHSYAKALDLYAQWESNVLHINYIANGTDWEVPDQDCTLDASGNPESGCIVQSKTKEGNTITRTNYMLDGWCDGTVVSKTTGDDQCNGTIYKDGNSLGVLVPVNAKEDTLILTAVWKEAKDTIIVKTTFKGSTSHNDCDSHVIGLKSAEGSKPPKPFWTYYNHKTDNDIDGSTIAVLDWDSINGYGGTETFKIYTLGGKDYYFFVHNYGDCSMCNGDTANNFVNVSSEKGRFETKTYYPTNACKGITSPSQWNKEYWNVFVYKDGILVDGKDTITSKPDISSTICSNASYWRVSLPGC